MKWKTGCYACPNSKGYPKSLFLDRSKTNYARKKDLFNRPKNITFVAVCNWMANNVKASFLGNYPIETIYNGIDLEVFRPKFNEENLKTCQLLKQKLNIKDNAKNKLTAVFVFILYCFWIVFTMDLIRDLS